VLTSNPDGSVHALTQTDASGKVDVEVPHLGSVSVFTTANAEDGSLAVRRVSTYSNVDASTTFESEPVQVLYGQKLGTAKFVPVGPLPVGTESVRVELPCGGARENEGEPSSAIAFESVSVCDDMTEYFAVAWALDALGEPLAASVIEHLPAIPGDVTYELDFSKLEAFELFQPEVAPLSAEIAEVSARVTGLLDLARMDGTFIQKPPFGSANALPTLTDYFPEFELVLYATFATDANASVHRASSRWLRTNTLPASFSLDPNELASFESVSPVDMTEAHRPRMTFSLAPSGTLGNCVGGHFAWSDEVFTIWSDDRKFQSSGSFVLPELPPSLAEFAPSSTSTLATSFVGVGHQAVNGECSELPDSVFGTSASAYLPTPL
jgi:hypothetical protein